MSFWSPNTVRRRQVATADLWLRDDANVVPTGLKQYRRKCLSSEGKVHWANRVMLDDNPSEEAHILKAMKNYIIFSQFFGLMPVEGALKNDLSQLKWLSFKRFYTLSIITIYLLMTIQRIINIIHEASIDTFDFLGASGGPLCWTIFALRQAKLFPALIKQWAEVEYEMRTIGTLYNLRTHLDIWTVLCVIFSLGSVLSFENIMYNKVNHCTDNVTRKIHIILATGNSDLFPISSEIIIWKILVYTFLIMYTSVTWIFSELTFIVFSYSLYQRFKLLNTYLEQHSNKNMPIRFWLRMRLIYNSLSRLTTTLDNYLSLTTCMLFASNTCFICIGLLQIFTSSDDVSYYYPMYSVARTVVMSLIASYIHDQSKQTLSILFQVPAASFCTEVFRFQMEVIADDITLTGCQFFSITRSFMLTVAGTIITYEVVLLQFLTLRRPPSNVTAYCSMFSYLNDTSSTTVFYS